MSTLKKEELKFFILLRTEGWGGWELEEQRRAGHWENRNWSQGPPRRRNSDNTLGFHLGPLKGNILEVNVK